jgi:hypothetical protein
MPKPVLQAMVLADHVYRDAGTGKFLIIGTFGTLWRRKRREAAPETEARIETEIEGPVRYMRADEVSQVGSPYLYIALTGVHGITPLALKCVNLADSSVVLEGDVNVNAKDPLALAEFSLPLPPFDMGPGTYSLDLLHEGEILGSWRISVKVLEEGKSQ